MVTKTMDMFTDPADQIILDEPAANAQRDGMRTLRTSHKNINMPVRRRRREALKILLPLLKEWEGTTLYVEPSYGSHRDFFAHNLRFDMVGVEFHPWGFNLEKSDLEKEMPSVIVLRGKKGGQIRIFTDYLEKLRVNDYGDYKHYLLDFRCGVGQWTLDNFRTTYSCLILGKYQK